ncbi:MAG: hypothetical protein HKN12_04870, partial [Gemmatimonadetes bacterium]|nr:hypothetical protein [Gemmatimonadota bacterium]
SRTRLRQALGLDKEANALTVREGDWKLVHDLRDGAWTLFDLSTDPGEFQDVASAHPERVAAMRPYLEAVAARERPEESDNVPLTEEQIEALRGLGYVE